MIRIKDLEQSFIGAFGAMGGIILFMIFISLYTIIIAGSGYYILKKYNKKDEKGEETPLLKELSNYQYIGIILILFGTAPFLHHLFSSVFFGFGLQAGEQIYENIME